MNRYTPNWDKSVKILRISLLFYLIFANFLQQKRFFVGFYLGFPLPYLELLLLKKDMKITLKANIRYQCWCTVCH